MRAGAAIESGVLENCGFWIVWEETEFLNS